MKSINKTKFNENRKSTMHLLGSASSFKLNDGKKSDHFETVSKLQLKVPKPPCIAQLKRHIEKLQTSQVENILVIVDGLFSPELSHLDCLPDEVQINKFEFFKRSKRLLEKNFEIKNILTSYEGVYSNLNSVTSRNAVCIFAESGWTSTQVSLRMLLISTGSKASASLVNYTAPRFIVLVGQSASLEIIEEHISLTEGKTRQFTNSAMECYLAKKSSLQHRYVQLVSPSCGNYHFKSTYVDQGEKSRYECTEIGLGAYMSRHDLFVTQSGTHTETYLRHFSLAGNDQSHEIISKIQLDHPSAIVDQKHKSIIAQPTGRITFDANIKVGRGAKNTMASQLSRNLILAKKANLNCKPKLQIIAEDVKCSHGCTVSDLESHEVFYFASRGIGEQEARQVLAYSFGLEVICKVNLENLKKRMEDMISNQLKQVFSDRT